MNVSIIKWHKGKKEPEKDGTYLTITKHSGAAQTMLYTVEGGWNTYRKDNGTYSTIREEKDRKEWREYVQCWSELPKVEEIINVQ